jgi:hypothetical protein
MGSGPWAWPRSDLVSATGVFTAWFEETIRDCKCTSIRLRSVCERSDLHRPRHSRWHAVHRHDATARFRAGEPAASIIDGIPDLTEAHVLAAVAYAEAHPFEEEPGARPWRNRRAAATPMPFIPSSSACVAPATTRSPLAPWPRVGSSSPATPSVTNGCFGVNRVAAQRVHDQPSSDRGVAFGGRRRLRTAMIMAATARDCRAREELHPDRSNRNRGRSRGADPVSCVSIACPSVPIAIRDCWTAQMLVRCIL